MFVIRKGCLLDPWPYLFLRRSTHILYSLPTFPVQALAATFRSSPKLQDHAPSSELSLFVKSCSNHFVAFFFCSLVSSHIQASMLETIIWAFRRFRGCFGLSEAQIQPIQWPSKLGISPTLAVWAWCNDQRLKGSPNKWIERQIDR